MADKRPNITTEFTNNSQAPQGIHTINSAGVKETVFLRPRQSKTLTVTADEMDHLVRLSFLGISGVERPAQRPTLRQTNDALTGNAQGTDVAELQTKLQDALDVNAKLGADFAALREERDKLKEDLGAVTQERDDLLAASGGGSKTDTAFTTKHKGAGVYSVFDSEGNEVVTKLSADDVDAFNAMSEEAKAAYVEENKDKTE